MRHLFRGREVDSCDVCLLLNLGLLTEERARIVDHRYLLYVPAWRFCPTSPAAPEIPLTLPSGVQRARVGVDAQRFDEALKAKS